jgi:DNA repair exonuclease SbcCD ATPase subunit
MKLNYILIENFMSHEKTEIDFTKFNSALIIARDKNDIRTSNAVGKTTLFFAISYCLFGVTPFKTLDKIIKDHCDYAKVTLELTINNNIYKIIRFRKLNKSDLRLFIKENDSWKDITQKTSSETEVELNKIIKISFAAFNASVLFSQENFYGLASSSAKDRKNLLKDVLNLIIYSKLEKIAQKKAAPIKVEIDKLSALQSSYGNPEIEIAENNEKINLLKEELSKIELLKEQKQSLLDDLKIELSELEKQNSVDISDLKKNASELLAEISLIKNEIDQIDNIVLSNTNKINKYTSQIDSSKLSLKKNSEELEKKLKIEHKKIQEIDDLLKKYSNKEVEGKTILSQLIKCKSNFSNSIPEGDSCTHCLQVVTKEHRENCEQRRISNLNKINDDIKITEETLVKLNKVIKATSLERSQAEIYFNEIEKHKKEIEESTSTISKLENLIKEIQESGKANQSRLNLLNKSLQDKNEKNSNLQDVILKRSSNFVKNKIDLINKDILLNSKSLKEISEKKSILNTDLGKLKAKIEADTDLLSKISEISKILETKQKEYSIRYKVWQGYAPSGIPTMIINTILDDLQIASNEFLSKLRPDIEIIFSIVKTRDDGQEEDTLDITYKHKNNEREWEGLSGAQKVLVSLSLKLALSSVIQKRLGIDIKFLEFDELDARLDDASKDTLSEVIKLLQKAYMILMITHNDYLKDRFQNAILVEGSDTGSNGKLVSSW